MMVLVADRTAFDIDSAAAHIAKYGKTYDETVRHYDLGSPDIGPGFDVVTTDDIGRLTLINARLDGNDAAALLRTDLDLLLRPLSVDLRLEDVPIDPCKPTSAYAVMVSAYWELRKRNGIGKAKATKLLHLKRPHLFPILDSHVVAVYEHTATAESRRLGTLEPEYWSAIASDVRRNAAAFADIRDRLNETPGAGRLGLLTDVRMQDILAWRP